MRLWNNEKPVVTNHFDTLISSKAEIIGDIKFSGGLHIDGKVQGNVLAEEGSGAVVRISDRGVVHGEIKAPNVIINGCVTGDVHSTEHLELAQKATVTGDIFYTKIEMVMGAEVNGSLVNRSVAGDTKTEFNESNEVSSDDVMDLPAEVSDIRAR